MRYPAAGPGNGHPDGRPSQRSRSAQRAPTVQATIATFTATGFTLQRLEQVPDQSAASLKEAYDRARVRADSLLRLLPDAEFSRGLEALERAAAAETTPSPVIRRLDLLVLQAPG